MTRPKSKAKEKPVTDEILGKLVSFLDDTKNKVTGTVDAVTSEGDLEVSATDGFVYRVARSDVMKEEQVTASSDGNPVVTTSVDAPPETQPRQRTKTIKPDVSKLKEQPLYRNKTDFVVNTILEAPTTFTSRYVYDKIKETYPSMLGATVEFTVHYTIGIACKFGIVQKLDGKGLDRKYRKIKI